jgi:hypothetical protein
MGSWRCYAAVESSSWVSSYCKVAFHVFTPSGELYRGTRPKGQAIYRKMPRNSGYKRWDSDWAPAPITAEVWARKAIVKYTAETCIVCVEANRAW